MDEDKARFWESLSGPTSGNCTNCKWNGARDLTEDIDCTNKDVHTMTYCNGSIYRKKHHSPPRVLGWRWNGK